MSEICQEFETKEGLKTEVAVGLGYGQCQMYHAGGVFKRTVSFAVGSAIS